MSSAFSTVCATSISVLLLSIYSTMVVTLTNQKHSDHASVISEACRRSPSRYDCTTRSISHGQMLPIDLYAILCDNFSQTLKSKTSQLYISVCILFDPSNSTDPIKITTSSIPVYGTPELSYVQHTSTSCLLVGYESRLFASPCFTHCSRHIQHQSNPSSKISIYVYVSNTSVSVPSVIHRLGSEQVLAN